MTPLRLACLGLLGLLPISAFADAAPLDLTALIECRQSVGDYNAVAPVVADPLKAVANGLQPCRRPTSS